MGTQFISWSERHWPKPNYKWRNQAETKRTDLKQVADGLFILILLFEIILKPWKRTINYLHPEFYLSKLSSIFKQEPSNTSISHPILYSTPEQILNRNQQHIYPKLFRIQFCVALLFSISLLKGLYLLISNRNKQII